MKWYNERIHIRDVSHEGLGIGTLANGKVAFINGALPGEEVEAVLQSKKKGVLFGRTESVVSPSEVRVDPICPHYQLCGGCSMQHIDMAGQIEFKEQRLKDNLERIGHLDGFELEPTLNGNSEHYRRKARMGIKYVEKKGGVIIGFREKGSSLITPLTDCKALAMPVPQHLERIRQTIAQLSIRNRVPQVELGVGEDTVSYIFRVLDRPTEEDLQHFSQFAQDTASQVYIQPKGLDSIEPVWPTKPVELTYSLPEEGISFEFKAFDFIQVNTSINRAMIRQAIEWLAPSEDETIVDLFCGLGNFTLPLARHAKYVYGLEANADLMLRANKNAALNGLEAKVGFITQNLYDNPDAMIPYLKKSDAVLLDPPRSGALEAVERIAKCKNIGRIVYVSCNSATLARDLDLLVNKAGFQLARVGAMNMFPHTAHGESMALLTRG